MKPTWIVENIVKEPSFRELAEAVKAAGYPLIELNGDFENRMINHLREKCVIFNGSINMCKLAHGILAPLSNDPILYSTWENYLCSRWYSKLGRFLFNDDYVMAPLAEVQRRLWWFYEKFAKEATIFIRPDSGDKTFKGGPLDLQDAERFFDQFESEKDSLVVVSSPKTIRGEWRFVVSHTQKIIAVSSYRYQGLRTLVPSAPFGAIRLVHQILSQGYFPDKIFCIDIAEDADGNHWLVELTSFSGAGLYACDKSAIVRAVSEQALLDYQKIG